MALQPPFLTARQSGPTPGRIVNASSAPAAPPEAAATLTVGPGICLKGEAITDCDTLVVGGVIEVATQARLLRLSERGSFKGEATVDVAEIRGRFEGTLNVRQKLVVFATGRVRGHVSYGSLVIEEGGELAGEVVRANPAQAALPLQAAA